MRNNMVFFIDLSKAFNTINHSLLSQKWEYYSIRGAANNWLQSQLSNRFQDVEIIVTVSQQISTISCGAPQG